MENTKNLGLKKWEGGDRILHTEFNDNWDKIDGAMLGKLGKAEKIGRKTGRIFQRRLQAGKDKGTQKDPGEKMDRPGPG